MHRKKTKLIWRIFPSFLVIILLSLTVEAWYSTSYFKSFFLETARRELMVRAFLMQDRFARALYVDGLSPPQIDALCKKWGEKIQTRITVILHSGEVIGDSFARVETMENHRKRPEIQKALSGEKRMAIRYSPTLDKNMMYIALPVDSRSDPAVIRTAVAISDIDAKVADMRNSISLVLVLTTMAAALASLYVSRRITRPVEQMRQGAQEFSKGNLTNRLPCPDTDELSQLAEAMNLMASELDKKIMDVKNRSRELEAVHASMQEGVIAINGQEQIITINKAAAKIFDFSPETLKTKHVLEVARNYDLQVFFKKALATSEPVEDDIVIDADERMVLNIHSSALYDAHDKRMGTLIIFHDITRIRLLETMHKDFAANVSHELKTPLTTIKGFIETLQQMMADGLSASAPDFAVQSGRFLGIIEKNVNRMVSLIDDLLALSRLERLKGTDVQLEAHPLADLIQKVVRFCADRARSRGITMEVHCPDAIAAMVDPTLMEQAVFNLVDNAIKYSGDGTCVTINAELKDRNIQIQVKDTGQGIDAAHLSKVFNRFYRVDKGRSRDQGGTGLGLAIVKHIVKYHNGNIEVESRRGKGTCFTITIPGATRL